jgi:chemotaxis protein methyltransferase CheR
LSISATDYAYVVQLMRERSAVALDAEQQYLVESRLAPVVKASGSASIRALIERLRREPYGPLHVSVVEAMTIQETSFFRDQHPFDALKAVVLPELIERRKREKTLLFWSGACATGQEPYSLAMLLLEHFPQLSSWRIRILATDIASSALAKARAGVYSKLEVSRGIPAQLLSKYFERSGEEYRARDVLRASIEWKQLNLGGPWPALSLFDVIFLRNVLIYFSQQTRAEVLRAVRGVIRTDGYLFLGSTETSFGSHAAFDPAPLGKTTVYRPTRIGP